MAALLVRSALVAACLLTSSFAASQELPDRGAALVTLGHTFAFYSDRVTNLHDFLVLNARSRESVEPSPDCFAALAPEQRVAFEHAREHYKVFATPAGNRLLMALRYRLAGFGDAGLADAGAIDAALAELEAAAPAYDACWWPAHDARNRRWIAAAQPLVAAHEEALVARLTELYGANLERPFPVDVVSYVSFSGADSVVDPDHLLVSSVAPANDGNAALEVLFHEASHTVFGPRLDGRLWTDLEAAAQADGAPLPGDFWHAMLFYTTGSAVKARFAATGVEYEPYVYAQGLFERSWPSFREPLERLWQPYLDGRAPLTESLRQLVAAHKLPGRGDAFVGASRTFVFYSDLVTNLHDFLVWNARSPKPIEPAPDCLAALPDGQRAAFEHARDYYTAAFANGNGELVLLSLRWRLAKLGEVSLADPRQIDAAIAELAPATPAYEKCWWPQHDARNRRWIAGVLPLLEANEAALRARLAELYGPPLARSLPVDVVGYAGPEGGSTVVNPPQLSISSAAAGNAGDAGLEAVMHEASHTLFGPRTPGPLWTALQQASSAAAKPLPEDLAHLLLYLTTGKAVQARLNEQGVPGYEPFVYRERLLDRSAPALREALERAWLPYIDGRVPMADAAKQLVEALPAAPR